MKKLPYMFIAALMAFASCGNEENNEPEKRLHRATHAWKSFLTMAFSSLRKTELQHH